MDLHNFLMEKMKLRIFLIEKQGSVVLLGRKTFLQLFQSTAMDLRVVVSKNMNRQIL